MNPRCPRCGAADLPAASRFCLACGQSLDATPAAGAAPSSYTPPHLSRDVLTTRTALEGELKRVTVLFTDIAGSLSMAQRLDPEDVHAVVNGYFKLALEEVHAEQGTLNQYRGDGFMALFGAPRTRGDEALRAVRAALAIRAATEGYSASVRARFGVPFVVRMGVHAGLVWVGSIGTELRRDYTAEGPTVGIAARLEELAAPDQILVSGEVASRVEPYLDVRPLGDRILRDVEEPIAVHEVVDRNAASTRLDVERARGLSRFVGREVELEEIAARLAAVGPGGSLWLELRGEPGSGKSRLALEAQQASGAQWLEGRCREAAERRAYAAWTELLERWIASEPGGGAGEAAAKLLRLVAGGEGTRTPEAIATGLRELLAEAFGAEHANLVFEDVHWIDPSSRQTLDHLLRNPPAGGLRVVATSRRENPLAWGDEVTVRRIELEALEPHESAQLARGLLGDSSAAEPLVALATQRGGGNPLFVEELARTLHEGPAPLREAARLEVAWRRAPARLPASLEEVIEARIDALPDPAKRLLQTLAVVGRPLTPELLEAVEIEARDALPELLVILEARGVLARRTNVIELRHELFREVAYRQLLRDRRDRIHRQCAEVLALQPGAESAAAQSEIGFHHDRAGFGSDALRHLAAAGHAYLELSACEEAVAHLRRAWEILAGLDEPEGPLRAQVGIDLANALNSLDRAGEAEAVLAGLDAELLGESDQLGVAAACVSVGWVCWSEHAELGKARRLVDRGIALARATDTGMRVEGMGHAYRIRIEHLDGELSAALASAGRVAELATAQGDRFALLFGRGNEGYVLCDAGEVERALELCRDAVRLAREAASEVGVAMSQAWLAKALLHAGEIEGCFRAADQAREAGGRSGQISTMYNAEIWSAEAHLLRGEPRRAAECTARMAELNDRWPTTADHRARAALAVGDFDQAAEIAARCLDGQPPRLIRARVLRTLGLALGLARPVDAERGEALLGEALDLCDQLGLRPIGAHVCAGLAELCRARRRDDRAAYYAKRAVREWQACGMPAHAAAAARSGVED